LEGFGYRWVPLKFDDSQEDIGQVKLLLETVPFCGYLQRAQGLNLSARIAPANSACKFQVLLKLQEAASHAKDTGLRH
jgi:hypothetical protein